jgi:hypothetical protein
MSPAAYTDQLGREIPTVMEFNRREAGRLASEQAIKEINDREAARALARHQAKLDAQAAQDREQADALAAALKPWAEEHAKIEAQRDQALAQYSACLKKVESDRLSLRYTSDALAAQAILESYESQLARSESRKPS